jgi:hypothetical protein
MPTLQGSNDRMDRMEPSPEGGRVGSPMHSRVFRALFGSGLHQEFGAVHYNRRLFLKFDDIDRQIIATPCRSTDWGVPRSDEIPALNPWFLMAPLLPEGLRNPGTWR